MRGKCEITIRIGSMKVSQPMWVSDIQGLCKIAADFLEPLGCVVNLRDSTHHFVRRRCHYRGSSPGTQAHHATYCAVLDQTVTLPLVPVRTEGPQKKSGEFWSFVELVCTVLMGDGRINSG